VADKRRYPRKVVRVRVKFQVGTGAWAEGYSRDMSLGGMFVVTNAPAPFGGAVLVVLHLDSGHEITVQSTVRWTEPDGMGVQFAMMGARDTHALTQVLLAAPISVPEPR